jgi:hypothetical protein
MTLNIPKAIGLCTLKAELYALRICLSKAVMFCPVLVTVILVLCNFTNSYLQK